MTEILGSGCSIHGPTEVCGHTEENCPDRPPKVAPAAPMGATVEQPTNIVEQKIQRAREILLELQDLRANDIDRLRVL